MKKTKLFAGVILAASMMGLALTGCGGGKTEVPPASSTATDKPADAPAGDDFKLVLKLSHVFTQDEQLTKSMV